MSPEQVASTKTLSELSCHAKCGRPITNAEFCSNIQYVQKLVDELINIALGHFADQMLQEVSFDSEIDQDKHMRLEKNGIPNSNKHDLCNAELSDSFETLPEGEEASIDETGIAFGASRTRSLKSCDPFRMLLEENENLADEVKHKNETIQQMADLIECSKAMFANTKQDLAITHEKNTSMQQEISYLRDELSNLASLLCQSQEDIQELRKEREDRERQSKVESKTMAANFRQRTKALALRLKEKTAQNLKLNDHLQGLRQDAGKIQLAQEENSYLQDRIRQTSEQRVKLESEVRKGLIIMQSCDVEKKRLQKQLEKLEKDVHEIICRDNANENPESSGGKRKNTLRRRDMIHPSSSILKYLWPRTKQSDNFK